jgi:hypothetical protein
MSIHSQLRCHDGFPYYGSPVGEQLGSTLLLDAIDRGHDVKV